MGTPPKSSAGRTLGDPGDSLPRTTKSLGHSGRDSHSRRSTPRPSGRSSAVQTAPSVVTTTLLRDGSGRRRWLGPPRRAPAISRWPGSAVAWYRPDHINWHLGLIGRFYPNLIAL